MKDSKRKRFEDQVAMVTGAAGGMGSAVANLFAEEGAQVILVDVDKKKLDSVAKDMRKRKLNVTTAVCDQTKEEDVQALFKKVVEKFDRFDVCFANAGLGTAEPFIKMSVEKWRQVIDVNINGTFMICQAAARRMKDLKKGGAIVVTSSSGAVVNTKLFSAYCASKAALNMMVEVAAGELGPFDIRINAVMPGVTETAMTSDFLATKMREIIEFDTPLGRVGRAEDVAKAVAFLASSDSDFISGTTLLVDGGGRANGSHWFSNDARDRGHAKWMFSYKRMNIKDKQEKNE